MNEEYWEEYLNPTAKPLNQLDVWPETTWPVVWCFALIYFQLVLTSWEGSL